MLRGRSEVDTASGRPRNVCSVFLLALQKHTSPQVACAERRRCQFVMTEHSLRRRRDCVAGRRCFGSKYRPATVTAIHHSCLDLNRNHKYRDRTRPALRRGQIEDWPGLLKRVTRLCFEGFRSEGSIGRSEVPVREPKATLQLISPS